MAFERVLLVGDSSGLPMLTQHIPKSRITGFIAASVRPQYLNDINALGVHFGLPVLVQPKVTDPAYQAFLDDVRQRRPDALVCYSYSMLIRRDLLEIVGRNAFNVHYSLLPLNRGPNPVQWAMIRDEKRVGVSLHRMDERFDGGDIIAQRSIPILHEDTWTTLVRKLGVESHELLRQQLPGVLENEYAVRPQREDDATVNPRLTPNYPRIDFAKMTDRDVFNLIRAQVRPLAGAFVMTSAGPLHFDCWMSMQDVAHLRQQFGASVGAQVC